MAAITLEIVEAALDALAKGGQSYSRAGFTFTRVDWDKLWKARKDLMAENASKSAIGRSFVFDVSSGEGTGESNEWGDG